MNGQNCTKRIREEIRRFHQERQLLHQNAAQTAALQIIARMDLDTVLRASSHDKQTATEKLRRLLNRERLKGLNSHWSYDINRHIALKQALDRITASL